MEYSDFTLEKVLKTFELSLSDRLSFFSETPRLEYSNHLAETISYNLPLALSSNTEEARSELLITPILIELRKQFHEGLSLFSGIDFNLDPQQGLNGSCDFIISRSPELLLLKAPIITLVEAKKENINAGLGQCVAEMVAAQLFNEREGNNIKTIYGVVTTGDRWKFLRLSGKALEIELGEHLITNMDTILGILAKGINESET